MVKKRSKSKKAVRRATVKPAMAEPIVHQPAEITSPEIIQSAEVLAVGHEKVDENSHQVHKTKSTKLSLGAWAYIVGISAAFIAALILNEGPNYAIYAMLALLGFLVALLNITEKEVLIFLVATVAFIVSANSVSTVLSGSAFAVRFLNNVIIFTAASAFVVSMKAIIQVAKAE